MAKIVIIGAGSVIFCKTVLNDFFACDAFKGSTYALVNRTKPKLDKMENYANMIIKKHHIDAHITETTD